MMERFIKTNNKYDKKEKLEWLKKHNKNCIKNYYRAVACEYESF